MQISSRAQNIEPFYVMEVAKAASALGAQVAHTDAPMVFLNIGEPDFTAPPLVQEAAQRAVHNGHSQYTPALGLPQLRERISAWYASRFGVQGPASRIVVTEAAWGPRTRGVLLASPSNPTGTSVHPDELRRIHQVVQSRGGITLVDEIYLALSHDAQFGQTALALDDAIISINSFSKYFNMTGWRLGWMVVPEVLVPVIERLAQNLFICPSTIAQHAALACFEDASIALYEQRRAEFKARRDYFIPQLNALGLTVPVMPDGAFYAWANCSELCQKLGIKDSWDFAFEVMNRAHVAITPGRDFGTAQTAQFVRFSTASSMKQLETAIARLRAMLAT